MIKNQPILLALLSVGSILNFIANTIDLPVTLNWIVLLLGVAMTFYSALCLVANTMQLKKKKLSSDS
ncbi:hypothetical protein RBI89_15700 [Bacillus subtilis]|uniref:hypothetical protein n=1 Tax=Bacillus subtilis TaxID=1423 RepID=UPI0027DEAECE|nr:hypothetical protein [Bacillus subtilis]MDQ4710938.1 hypothetical protein [Bacillus subtilis]